jgi:hypothetical protein
MINIFNNNFLPTQFWDKFGCNMVVVTYLDVFPNINDTINRNVDASIHNGQLFIIAMEKVFSFCTHQHHASCNEYHEHILRFPFRHSSYLAQNAFWQFWMFIYFLKQMWVFFPTLIQLHLDSLFQPFPSINFCNDVALFHKLVAT